LQDIIKLVSCLSIIASKKLSVPQRDLGDWTASLIFVSWLDAMQSNSIDCGLWILTKIVAVIQGYDLTSLQEKDMTVFQHYL
ncbi:hypothetical protein PAXRUDRAFT_38133, partial [Paxillus rubicundulus Ve08.2h10]